MGLFQQVLASSTFHLFCNVELVLRDRVELRRIHVGPLLLDHFPQMVAACIMGLDAEKKFEWFTGMTALFAHTNE